MPHSVGVCHSLPSLSLSLSQSLSLSPNGWRPFTFSLLVWPCVSQHVALFSSLSSRLRFSNLRSSNHFRTQTFPTLRHTECEATPETHFDARALRLPRENADARRKTRRILRKYFKNNFKNYTKIGAINY